jgi:hypothetical protein
VSVSPACGVVELNAIQRICGAASGGSMRTAGVGAGVGDGSALDARTGVTTGAGDGDGDGTGDGDGVTPVRTKQAMAKKAARIVTNFAMDVSFPRSVSMPRTPKKAGSEGRIKER